MKRKASAHWQGKEPAGAKGLHCDRPRHGFGRRQHPQFAHQLGKCDPATPSPRTLRFETP